MKKHHTMKIYRFRTWSENAVSGIKFPPDRNQVQQELYDHMEDHYNALIDAGCAPEEAEQRTTASMGDAWAIAPQLAALHKPLWGYLLRLSRILLILVLCVTLVPVGKYLWDLCADLSAPMYDIRAAESYAEKGTYLQSSWELDGSFQSETSHFTLTDASVWSWSRTQEDGSTEQRSFLAFHIRQTSYTPWALDPNFYRYVYTPLTSIWGEDSQGNYYYSWIDQDTTGLSEENVLQIWCERTGIFSYTYTFWVNQLNTEELDWLDVHYDRDGRDFVLRINIQGGDGK